MMKKRGIVPSALVWWIIAIGVLVLMLIIYSVINSEGRGLLGFLKELIKFRR